MAFRRINRWEWDSLTNKLFAFINGNREIAFDLDNITAQSPIISPNKITVVSSANNTVGTFTTLQSAFDSIPEPTTDAERRQVYTVYVPEGTYDEDVTINCFRRSINVVCIGRVDLGSFDANDNWEAGTASRDLILDGTASSPALSSLAGIRDHVSFLTYHIDDGIPTHHTAYRNGLRVSGNVTAIDNPGDAGSNLAVHFTHCRVIGTVDFTGHTEGHMRMTASNSFFNEIKGVDEDTFPGDWGFEIDHAVNCKFADDITCWRYGSFHNCRFYGNFKCNSSAFLSDLQPCGFFNCYLVGSFTGPANSLRVDAATNYFVVNNSVTLGGSASKVIINSTS